MKRKFKHITQQTFNKAKELQKHGLKPGMLAQIIGASPATMSKIIKVSTLEEYLAETRKYYLTKTKKQAMPAGTPKPTTPQPALSEYKKQMLEQMQMQTESLQEIQQLLIHLSERRGWFRR